MKRVAFFVIIGVSISSCILYTTKYGGKPEYYNPDFHLQNKNKLHLEGVYVLKAVYCYTGKKRAVKKIESRNTIFHYFRFFENGSFCFHEIEKRDWQDNDSVFSPPAMGTKPLAWGFYRLNQDTVFTETIFVSVTTLGDDRRIPVLNSRNMERLKQNFLITGDSLLVIPGPVSPKDPVYCYAKSVFVYSNDTIDTRRNYLLYDKTIRRKLKLAE